MSAPMPPSIEEFLAHASFVRAIARAAVRGDPDVDDVVQATWLASIERGPRHGDSPRGWLATVARNAARGLKRGEGRRRTREARVARPESLPSTSEIAAKEEVRQRLLAAVLGLDEPYRSAVLLRYYEDLPPREVATRLGVPVETARTRVKRGLKLLRARLDGAWRGDRRAWALAVSPLGGADLGPMAQTAGMGLVAKVAAALLVLAGLVGAGTCAISRATHPVERTDTVALVPADAPSDGPEPSSDADGASRLRGMPASRARGGATIKGTVVRDPGEGEVTLSAARIGGFEMLDPQTMRANPLGMLSPPLKGDVVTTVPLAADGTFRLDGLTKGLYFVTARSDGDRARTTVVYVPADRGEAETALDLTRGPHTLTGRVVRADGEATTGWVYLQGVPDARMASAVVTWPRGTVPRRLGRDGTFRFEHLPPGKVALVVVEPGVQLLRLGDIPVPAETPLEFTLGSAGTKRGRIVDATSGDGLAGAEALVMVQRRGSDASFYFARAQADADGTLEVPDLGGKIHALVVAEGHVLGRALWRAEETMITLRLDRVARVEGRVLDEDHVGLEGVPVHAFTLGAEVGRVESTSDAEGRFDLPAVRPGEVMVFAHGGGFTSALLAEVKRGGFNPFVHTVKAGASLDIDLQVVPAGKIEGRLLGPDGEGLGGLTVEVAGEPWPDLRGPGFHPRRRPHMTDADGRFVMASVLPGEALRVVARTGDGRRIESPPFSLAAGGLHTLDLGVGPAQHPDVPGIEDDDTPAAGEVSVPKAPPIVRRAHQDPTTRWTLRVRGPDGRAVARASQRVYVRFEGQPWFASGFGHGRTPLEAQTHPFGTGQVYVEVFDAEDEDRRPLPHGAALVAPQDLPTGGGTLEVTLPPERRVRGRVVDPAGKGVAGVAVRAFPHFRTERLPVADHDPHAFTRTEADGTFELRHLGPFAYVLCLDVPHAYAPSEGTKVQAGDEDVVVRLRKGASARIRVRDEHGGPVIGASVQIQRASRVAASGKTDGRGLFVAAGLDPDLVYEVSAYVSGNPPPFLPRAIENQAPGEIELVLPRAYGVSGLVVDEGGRPLPWALVLRQETDNSWMTQFADEAGHFSLTGLPAGDHVLRVSPPLTLRWFEGTEHRVRAPISDLRLVAKPGAGIRFRLPEDVAPRSVTLRISDEDNEVDSTTFHAQLIPIRQRSGTIHGLDPDHRYVLYAIAEGRVFLAGGLCPGPQVVDVTLAPGRTILVRLEVAGGLPAGLRWRDASVQAEGPGWRQRAGRIDAAEPTWWVQGVPPGPCTVRARLERAGTRYAAEARDVLGNEVRLRLEEVDDRARLGRES